MTDRRVLPDDLALDYDSDGSSNASTSSAGSRPSSAGAEDLTPPGTPRQGPSVALDVSPSTAVEGNSVAPADQPVVRSPVAAFTLRRLTSPVAHRSVAVTPYLLYQMIRPFGFPKRLIVFPPAAEAARHQSVVGASGTPVYVGVAHGLAQFDSEDDCESFLVAFAQQGRWVNKERRVAHCEVHLGGGTPDVFSVGTAFAHERKVFATSNTAYTLVVTPGSIPALGPRCMVADLINPSQDELYHMAR
jgi:hypothetical protein